MRINGTNPSSPPTNPYHIARAYGVRPPTTPVTPGAAGAGPASPAGVESSSPARADGVRKLVAGVVPGGVAFDTGGARPAAGTLPMYRHPADKNAAATAVTVGRSLDVRG